MKEVNRCRLPNVMAIFKNQFFASIVIKTKKVYIKEKLAINKLKSLTRLSFINNRPIYVFLVVS